MASLCIKNISLVCIDFTESPVENLAVPDDSRHGSDGVQLFDRIGGTRITNGYHPQSVTDLGDSEVQEILGNDTATVQVLVEMNGQDDGSTEAGWMPYVNQCFLNLAWSQNLSYNPCQCQNQNIDSPCKHGFLFVEAIRYA